MIVFLILCLCISICVCVFLLVFVYFYLCLCISTCVRVFLLVFVYCTFGPPYLPLKNIKPHDLYDSSLYFLKEIGLNIDLQANTADCNVRAER